MQVGACADQEKAVVVVAELADGTDRSKEKQSFHRRALSDAMLSRKKVRKGKNQRCETRASDEGVRQGWDVHDQQERLEVE